LTAAALGLLVPNTLAGCSGGEGGSGAKPALTFTPADGSSGIIPTVAVGLRVSTAGSNALL